jgi:hypothetical protein
MLRMAKIANMFPDPPIPDFDAAGLMVPPWVKYPAIPRASIGWRMGEGEEYWDNFRVWWEQQLPEVRDRVQSTYPEPAGWSGFYERV